MNQSSVFSLSLSLSPSSLFLPPLAVPLSFSVFLPIPSLPTLSLSIAFRHLHPNSATTGYATEGALFISAQLTTDAVSALRKVWVLLLLITIMKICQ